MRLNAVGKYPDSLNVVFTFFGLQCHQLLTSDGAMRDSKHSHNILKIMGLMALGLITDISLDNQDHKSYKYSNGVHEEVDPLSHCYPYHTIISITHRLTAKHTKDETTYS